VLRTVTFSDARVADAVNTRYVAAWTNRGPGFRNDEYWTEKNIFSADHEAYPTKNICTFFLNPEGRVFFYAAGSYSPDLFLKLLDDASALRGLLYDDAFRPRAGGLDRAAEFHAERADDCEADARTATEPDGWKRFVPERGKPLRYRGAVHVHGPSCGWSLRNGFDYWARLHRSLAARADLPTLEEIRFKYEYGNEFTEESDAAKRITKAETPTEPPAPRRPRGSKPVEKARVRTTDLLGVGLPTLLP
jgi:hypothetical protein